MKTERSSHERIDAKILQPVRPLLPQGDELPASPQAVCGGAAQLSRPAVAAGGVRDVLSLRAERRTVRADAGALDADERRASSTARRSSSRRSSMP